MAEGGGRKVGRRRTLARTPGRPGHPRIHISGQQRLPSVCRSIRAGSCMRSCPRPRLPWPFARWCKRDGWAAGRAELRACATCLPCTDTPREALAVPGEACAAVRQLPTGDLDRQPPHPSRTSRRWGGAGWLGLVGVLRGQTRGWVTRCRGLRGLLLGRGRVGRLGATRCRRGGTGASGRCGRGGFGSGRFRRW